jgi:hypothetical protein
VYNLVTPSLIENHLTEGKFIMKKATIPAPKYPTFFIIGPALGFSAPTYTNTKIDSRIERAGLL